MKKIVIVGPECTGKSTLSAQLAAALGCRWVPEFARDYCTMLQRPYGLHDVIAMAHGQLASQQHAETLGGQHLVCDTSPLVELIWADVKYATRPPALQAMVQEHDYALTLLTHIDIPWEDDPLREHPHQRQQLMDRYHRELQHQGIAYHLISGTPAQRLQAALALVAALPKG